MRRAAAVLALVAAGLASGPLPGASARPAGATAGTGAGAPRAAKRGKLRVASRVQVRRVRMGLGTRRPVVRRPAGAAPAARTEPGAGAVAGAPAGAAPAPGETAAPAAGKPAAPAAPAPAPAAPLPISLQATTDDRNGHMRLGLSSPAVAAGEVAVEFNNAFSEDPHDLFVEPPAGGDLIAFGTLEPGEVLARDVRLPAGTYRLFCGIGDHAARGMTARLEVR